MNYNKLTKAELICKINNIKKSTNKSDSIKGIKGYLLQIWELIITFKNILIKLTLISFFIQIFKKYKIFRTIWTIINTLVMTIFGISLIENSGIEILQHYFNEIKLIVSNFYSYVESLFSSKEIETPSSAKTNKNDTFWENSGKTTRNEESIKKGERNIGFDNWLKPQDPEVEVKNESSYTKFYIIGFILCSIITWYYMDNIKDVGSNIIEWMKSFKGGGDEPNNDPNWGRADRINQREALENIVKQKTQETESKLQELIEVKGKEAVRITSPSLEDLSEKVTDSWASGSISPDSSCSDETIKASSSKIKTTNNFFYLFMQMIT